MNLPKAQRYVIITDDNVKELYGVELQNRLIEQGLHVDLISIKPGERSKTRAVKEAIENQMFELGCGRDTLIIALGGGVVGDLAGYVAATYMRGIPLVHVPTTLLAMVDSSIGGKTGVDTEHGKNLVGAIWQPEKIILDVKYLETLSDEHLVNGLVEAIKMFLTHDAASFEYLEENLEKALAREHEVLEQIVTRGAQIKHGVVSRDERENNERMLLNFGHSIGHALELLHDFELLHGLAVGQGILAEAKMAELDGYISNEDFSRIQSLMNRIDLDLSPLQNASDEALFEKMKLDKKSAAGMPRYVILNGIGSVHSPDNQFAHELDQARLREALSSLND